MSKINKKNIAYLIEFQSGQFDKRGVLKTFSMFDNTSEEILGWIDRLLQAWKIEEQCGFYLKEKKR